MLRPRGALGYQLVDGGLAEEGDQALTQAHADRLEGLGLIPTVVGLERLLSPSPRARQQLGRSGSTGTSRSRVYSRRGASPMWKVSTTSRLLKSCWLQRLVGLVMTHQRLSGQCTSQMP
jgi:hypothetical protein